MVWHMDQNEKCFASKALVPNELCEWSNTSSSDPTVGSAGHAQEQEARITLAILFYRDGDFFDEQIRRWRLWPVTLRKKFYFMIVDDSSPARDRAVERYNDEDDINIIFYYIEVDKMWNIGGARNLVFHAAPTEYVFLIDSDLIVPVPIATTCLKLVEDEISQLSIDSKINGGKRNIYINFNRVFNESGIRRPHPAAMLLSRSAYWMCGGCDEDFVGNYGMTDPHFRWRASKTANIFVRDFGAVYLDDLVMMEVPDKLAIPRSPAHNIALFEEKMNSNIPWSNRYLRFPWKFVATYCLGGKSSKRMALNANSIRKQPSMTRWGPKQMFLS
jgi:hypothetical protein